MLDVRDFGVLGTSNDSAVFSAALAVGGAVSVPAGTWLVNDLKITSNGYLQGSGEGLTVLKKASPGSILKFWGLGPGAANHVIFAGARDLTLDGNGFSGVLLDMVYATRLCFYNVHCANNPDVAIDTVEVWDSRFYNVSCDRCGGATTPAVRVGSSRALSGFGSSSDSTNQLMFFGSLIETWKAGAIQLNPGIGGSLLHQIYFFGMKIETVSVRGPAIDISGNTRDIHIDDMWVFMGDFDAGFATPQNAINAHGDRNINVCGVFIANNAVATIANGVDIWNNGSYIDQIYGNLGTAPTGSLIAVRGGANHTIGAHTLVGPGVSFSGDLSASPVVSRPIRSVAGAVSDASFLSPPPAGTMAVDYINGRLYVKVISGAWRYATLSL